MKDYWEDRVVRPSNKLGNVLKTSRLTQRLTNTIFSVRAADEIFMAQVLRERGIKSVLDVACGAGKVILPTIADYTTGVDIAGYPADAARAKGYVECVQYAPPDYHFTISRRVDAITAIHLNAHISFEAYARILTQALQFLRPGGAVILINEYDNDGVSYKLLRRDFDKFEDLVKRMEHWHLEYETSFTQKFQSVFEGLQMVQRKPLIAGLLPSLHYYAYYTGHDPSPATLGSFVLADIPLSLINYAQSILSPRIDKCFTVGYVYETSRPQSSHRAAAIPSV